MKKTTRRTLDEQENALAARLAKIRAQKKKQEKLKMDRTRRDQNKRDIELGAKIREAALQDKEIAAVLAKLGFPTAATP